MNAIRSGQNSFAFTNPANLLQALNAREHSAFTVLHDGFATSLFKYAFNLIRDSEEAKDIVNQCFIAFFKQCGEFKTLDNIRNFLFKTTHNLSRNYLRDKQIHESIEKDVFGPVDGKEGYVFNLALNSELAHYLEHHILQLPEQQRNVIKRLILNGKTVEEVMAELKISRSQVYDSKRRGLLKLKTRLFYDKVITSLLPVLWTLVSAARKFF